jgi:hypothetical protein
VLGRTVIRYARLAWSRAALGVSPAPLWFSCGLDSGPMETSQATCKGQGGGIAVPRIPRLGEKAQYCKAHGAAPVTLNRKACVFQVIRILHYNHCHVTNTASAATPSLSGIAGVLRSSLHPARRTAIDRLRSATINQPMMLIHTPTFPVRISRAKKTHIFESEGVFRLR